MLSSKENGPCDATGVLALEEEGFSLAVLETEDLAITTDVELSLFSKYQRLFLQNSTPISVSNSQAHPPSQFSLIHQILVGSTIILSPLASGIGVRKRVIPFQGRSSRRRRYPRKCACWLCVSLFVVNLRLKVCRSMLALFAGADLCEALVLPRH